MAIVGSVMPSPVFIGFDDNGIIAPAGKLYTYVAGTLTAQTTYNNADLDPGNANANPVILNSAGRAVVYLSPTAYKFILKDSADVTIWTQDNVSAVPLSNINVDVIGTAGETLSAGDAVFLSDGSGGNTAGRWYKTDSDFTYSSTIAQSVGFAVAGIATGAVGSIRTAGRVTDLSGLSAGTVYYISATAGALTGSAPANARAMGQADSTTSLVISTAVITLPLASASAAGIVSLAAQTLGAGVKTFSSPPIGLPYFSRSTANFTKNNNTTLADVTGISFPVEANGVYVFVMLLHGISSSTANYKMTLTGPTAPTAVRFGAVAGAPLAGGASENAFGGTMLFTGDGGAPGAEKGIIVEGLLRNGANAGTVQLQAAQNTGEVSDTIIYAESCVIMFRIS